MLRAAVVEIRSWVRQAPVWTVTAIPGTTRTITAGAGVDDVETFASLALACISASNHGNGSHNNSREFHFESGSR